MKGIKVSEERVLHTTFFSSPLELEILWRPRDLRLQEARDTIIVARSLRYFELQRRKKKVVRRTLSSHTFFLSPPPSSDRPALCFFQAGTVSILINPLPFRYNTSFLFPISDAGLIMSPSFRSFRDVLMHSIMHPPPSCSDPPRYQANLFDFQPDSTSSWEPDKHSFYDRDFPPLPTLAFDDDSNEVT